MARNGVTRQLAAGLAVDQYSLSHVADIRVSDQELANDLERYSGGRMIFLTTDEHRKVVERLVSLQSSAKGVHIHASGAEYTSLMSCFAMHCRGAAESVLALHDRFGTDWFPATTGYLIVRSMFEVDVTSHYITQEPCKRSRQYIDFENVIRKNTLEAVERHRTSKNSTWREGMQLRYNQEYAPQKSKIDAEYARVRSQFEDKNGKRAKSWSGKSIYAMAKEVDHLEAYEIFYADLSSFAHVNVMLANRFLRTKGLIDGDGPAWSMRADEFDVASVFRYAAIFFTCFLELFGKEFKLWDASQVRACWDFPDAEGRKPRPG
jgi:hypothetical protein